MSAKHKNSDTVLRELEDEINKLRTANLEFQSAMIRIASHEIGSHEGSDDFTSSESCGTCEDIVEIAKKALDKIVPVCKYCSELEGHEVRHP